MEDQPLLQDIEPPCAAKLEPERVLPVALFAALAMASSSAAAYFAYATLFCSSPTKCQDEEASRYAGLVAGATSAANLLGAATFGSIHMLLSKNQQLGLLIWLGVRSMSTFMLLIGVSARNIAVALFGRVFEGLASDNVLHLLLNSIYVQTFDDGASYWVPKSLALYMIGISCGPILTVLLGNYRASLSAALGLFAVTSCYILMFAAKRKTLLVKGNAPRDTRPSVPNGQSVPTLTYTIKPFLQRPLLLLFPISLFCFNSSQSYVFDALMIHSTVRFEFTNRQHGYLVTIVHSIAALYIFSTRPLFELSPISSQTKHACQSVALLGIQALSLAGVGRAQTGRQLYLLSAMFALGLPAPSFIKEFFVGSIGKEERVSGLVVLTMAESLASVLGPMMIGTWQSHSSKDGIVFIGAAILVGCAAIVFTIGAGLVHQRNSGLGLSR